VNRPSSSRRLIATSDGQVEIVVRPGADVVLYFHGGHESAVTATAAELYVELGYTVVAVSRPGYGDTRVGPVPPGHFAGLVDQVRDQLGYECFLSVVGTSFGGPQAIAYASRFPSRVRSLILHSAAPSTRVYPDEVVQRLFAPVVFHPRVERFTWAAVSLLMRAMPRLGLRVMMSSLSTRPAGTWLPELSAEQRQEMREVFCTMRSGAGFVIDVHAAGAEGADARRRAQQMISCPTLVTASRSDRGVPWAHAEDFVATIPDARLVEITSPSHLFWIGSGRPQVIAAVRGFLGARAGG
jgi:pimeloyl-ACP methyl ester carboxylesterase